jgi:imidazole glycerol phosphate synthase glutamine amidotransferase subunit
MTRDVVIVRTGSANLASVRAAFTRLKCPVTVSSDPHAVASAALVVLPGVGAFGPAAQELSATGLADAIKQRVATDKPLLGICLGLQLLCETSDESPDARGLGVLPLHVARFAESPSLKIPHFGWNMVAPDASARWCTPGYAYFAHSYHLPAAPAGWQVAWCDYGGPFVAAAARGRTLACQFHPELSGPWGSSLLNAWVIGAGVQEALAC